MKKTEISKYIKKLKSIEPTLENLQRVAKDMADSNNPMMSNDEIREATAEFLLLETDDPDDPGCGVRSSVFFGFGNNDIPEKIFAKIVEKNGEKTRTKKENSDRFTKELIIAVNNGDKEKVELLVAAGANVNVTDPMENDHILLNLDTLLHIAILRRYPEIVDILIAAGANVDAQNCHGWTPLHMAAEHNQIDAARSLLAAGADVNLKGREDYTPLHAARSPEMILLFLTAGAGKSLNVKEQEQGTTPLHRVVERLCRKSVQIYVTAGADVNAKDETGRTPLMYIAEKKEENEEHIEIAKILITAGADVNLKNHYGKTAGDIALKSGNSLFFAEWAKHAAKNVFSDKDANEDTMFYRELSKSEQPNMDILQLIIVHIGIENLDSYLEYDNKLSNLLKTNFEKMEIWNDSVKKTELLILTERLKDNIPNLNEKNDILEKNLFER